MEKRALLSEDDVQTIEMDYNVVTVDLHLFRLTSEGDKDAFRQIFKKYAPLVEALVRRIIGKDAPCDDLVQDVFLKIWEKRQTLTIVEHPKAWIVRIACYTSYNYLKHEKVCANAAGQIKYLSRPYANEVDDGVMHKEMSHYIRRAIELLPTQTQLIYRLNKEDEMKIADIADHLQLSPQTVKNTLTTAVKRIKLYLREQGIAYLIIFLFFH